MVTFCYKKSSLDRAAQRVMQAMTKAVPVERPLVLGVGAVGFASTGRGELPAPTASMTRAMERALRRVEAAGRRCVAADAVR
jgi:hypothetical protein